MGVNAIKDRVTAVLQPIPQEAFADYFWKLYKCFQMCVVAMVTTVKGNKENLFVSFVLLVFTEHFRHTMYTKPWH